MVNGHQRGGHLFARPVDADGIPFDGHFQAVVFLEDHAIGPVVFQLHRNAGPADDVAASRESHDRRHPSGPGHGNGRILEVERIQGPHLRGEGIGHFISVTVLFHRGHGIDADVGMNIHQPRGDRPGLDDGRSRRRDDLRSDGGDLSVPDEDGPVFHDGSADRINFLCPDHQGFPRRLNREKNKGTGQ
ncbi:MAG: hypothetical protein BWX98_02145 [Candidatus Aminicenantes bacterium ADurb.Bin147]|nr:MAG: hypothetical protein BWX98_02145 [Candidatus Aminicenantes bacterium ADurb.Bin147]